MRQILFPEVITLSAELVNNKHNTKRTMMLSDILVDLKMTYQVAQGCYKDTQGVSFVVLPSNKEEIQFLLDIAFKQFNQESVLYQSKSGESHLVFSNYSNEKNR